MMGLMSEPVGESQLYRSGSGSEDPDDHAPLGFIGLGQVGTPMARRLLGWPGDFVVCDINHRATTPFSRHGARVRSTPAELAERTRIISVMVGNDDQVIDVITGADSILETASPGTIIAIHTAVSPGLAEAMAARAAEKGVVVVDAPVIGGVIGAMSGDLAMMIGGTADAVEAVRQPFSNMASLIAHMGGVGTGTTARLARNLITYGSFVVVGEAQALADGGGVDLKLLGEVVRHSEGLTGGPGAVMLRADRQQLAADDPLRIPFERTRRMGDAELDQVRTLADRLGVDVPISEFARANLGSALGLPET